MTRTATVTVDEIQGLLSAGPVLGRVELPGGECYVTVQALLGRGPRTRVVVTVTGVTQVVPLGALREVRAAGG